MKSNNKYFTELLSLTLAAMLALGGCAKKAEEKKAAPTAANITVARAESRAMQIVEQSVGEIDSQSAPLVSAEVAGRVEKVLVDIGDAVKAGQVMALIDTRDYVSSQQSSQADVKRLEALVANQQRVVARDRDLIGKKFISPAKLDDSESQLVALQQQLASARGQSERSGYSLSRTRIIAPVSGRVDSRLVAAGDFVTVGKGMFQIATSDRLRVRLPFPESAAARVKPGLAVVLSTPTAPGTLQGKVQEVRPMVGISNRAFEAIVEVANPGGWKPGASVNGVVVLEEHPEAVVVPEISVVLRPAGKVVYVVENDKAMQRLVRTGVVQNGMVEILDGLKAGDTVAVDGSGFLTDKAAVMVPPTGTPAFSDLKDKESPKK